MVRHRGNLFRLGKFALLVDCRNGMARRQRHDLITPAVEERIGADQQRPCSQSVASYCRWGTRLGEIVLVRPCSSSSPPLSLASRPRTRVFHLEPVGRAAGAVGRILPLRHDTFKPHLAGMGEDGLAITQRRHTTVYQLKPHFPPSLLPSWSN